MKCCAFGTVRMDIHAYQNIDELDQREEIKISEMSMTIGGSVYNTVSVLNTLNQDVVLYMLNANDDFADYIRMKLDKNEIHYVSCEQEKNDTATSLIFIDEYGKKKIISYDGERDDKYILKKLALEAKQYDLFYTSFYEINIDNCAQILDIMSLVKTTFVDLSPLIYEVQSEVINKVLSKVDIISGTEEEYTILLEKTGIKSYSDLLSKFSISMIFVKQGSQGATVYNSNGLYSYKPKEKRISHDTTGCGDTFNAGIILTMSNKAAKEHMLQEAVEMATQVAYNGLKIYTNRK